MTEGNVKALARYWLSKSLEAEESATLLFDHQQWSACISRLYYASFYAMNALLVSLLDGTEVECVIESKEKTGRLGWLLSP
jgi:uncharacterized protein (UPF0332 family)